MPSRLTRFSLRTLLIVVTALCVCLGVQLEWKRQRRVFVEEQLRMQHLDSLTPADFYSPDARYLPWLFNERAIEVLSIAIPEAEARNVDGEYQIHKDHPALTKAHRLFPEAFVVPWVFKGDTSITVQVVD